MFIDAFFETSDIFIGSFESASQFLDFIDKMLLIVTLMDLVDLREVSILMIGMDLRVGVEVHMVIYILNGAFVQNVPRIASFVVAGQFLAFLIGVEPHHFFLVEIMCVFLKNCVDVSIVFIPFFLLLKSIH